jgi:hypothetical protein
MKLTFFRIRQQSRVDVKRRLTAAKRHPRSPRATAAANYRSHASPISETWKHRSVREERIARPNITGGHGVLIGRSRFVRRVAIRDRGWLRAFAVRSAAGYGFERRGWLRRW